MMMMMIRETMFLMTTNVHIVIIMFHYCPKSFVNINFFNHKNPYGIDSIYTLNISMKKPKPRQGK